jgi:hypothetical protein
MSRHLHRIPLFLALVGAAALPACGGNPALSDRVVEDKGAEGFLDRIEKSCGNLPVGNQQLKFLLDESSDDTYFVDESSKLYFGRGDRDAYSSDINAFYPGGRNQPALDCIFAQLDE